MRYFKIYNRCVTQSRPYKELTEDQFLADIADYALDQISYLLDGEDCDRQLEEAFVKAETLADSEEGLDAGDFYLYRTQDDSRTVLDYNRKNA